MESIRLTPDGRILEREKEIPGSGLEVLSRTIDLAPGFTLSSFFALLRNYPDLVRLSEYLDPLLKMAAAVAPADVQNFKTQDIQGLVFYKTIAMKGFPGTPRVEIYNSLKGIRDTEKTVLKFFQVESLLAHSLVLGELTHVIFGDGQDSFSYDTSYSLFELVEGIAWELSFNFNPLQCTLRR